MSTYGVKVARLIPALATVIGVSCSPALLAGGVNVTTQGGVIIYTVPAKAAQGLTADELASARALPLPQITEAPPSLLDTLLADEPAPWAGATPGVVPGAAGDGKLSPVQLPLPTSDALDESDALAGGGITPQEYGSSGHPYTTMRVDVSSNTESKAAPYRAAGKLYFKIGSASYVCSASLIKRGVIVTAAHCVAEFGAQRFYSNWQFVPARYDKTAPYGTWNWAAVYVMGSYYSGTDPCAVPGVVCQNDVAVIRLAPQGKNFPGTKTGWFGYGWDGYGFTANNLALIQQLGYPVSHDAGLRMQRTDSEGYVSGAMANNTVWGSRQTGGASGGPEVVNLGVRATLTTPLGYEAEPNIVVGVTSWGYVDPMIQEEGASPFTSSNIVPLATAACAGGQAACK